MLSYVYKRVSNDFVSLSFYVSSPGMSFTKWGPKYQGRISKQQASLIVNLEGAASATREAAKSTMTPAETPRAREFHAHASRHPDPLGDG